MLSPPQYSRLIEPHRRALEKLELDLDFFLRDVEGIDIYTVSSRLKEFESALKKSAQISIPVEELDDLAGLRIIVGTKNELPILERFISRQEYGKDLRILKRKNIAKQDGYRALHLVVEVGGNYSRSAYPGRVEIQIQTIFTHSFNFLSRSWRYKQASVPSKEWNDLFTNLSVALNEIEEAASNLYTQLTESRTNDSGHNLTPHSLIVLVAQEFEEEMDMENAVDSCRMFIDIGYKSNGQLRAFFQRKDVWDLFNKVQAAENNNESVNYLIGMGKCSFWHLFGTRMSYPGLDKFIDSIISVKKKNDP